MTQITSIKNFGEMIDLHVDKASALDLCLLSHPIRDCCQMWQ